MPFDVFQIDDGWQLAHGDWEPNKKFPSGMNTMAEKISANGRTPGLWLAPFMVSANSQLQKITLTGFYSTKKELPSVQESLGLEIPIV